MVNDGRLLKGKSSKGILLKNLKHDDTGDYKCVIKTELDEVEQIHSQVVYKKTAVQVPEVFTDKKSVTGEIARYKNGTQKNVAQLQGNFPDLLYGSSAS